LPSASPHHTPVESRRQFQVGDLLVSYLEALKVQYVFGVPGGAIEPLYNALARSARRGGPRAVVARHETGAAFMADGYHRQTGRLGVCCATTGPGATNLLTGVASAYENRIPLLVVTGQTTLANFGRGALQESSCTGVNTIGIYQYCTRYNTLISHVDQFEHKLTTAIMTAFQDASGPVHLSIPLDLLRHPAPVDRPSYDLAALLQRPSLMDDNAVVELTRQILLARRAVFVIGEGCGEAIGGILELAGTIGAAIVTTPHGKGLVSPYHPLFRGVVGFAGHESARQTLSDPLVDIVVAVGVNLGEWSSNNWDTATLLNERLVHIDSTEWHLNRSPMARLHVRGRISTIFEQLLERLCVRNGPARQDGKVGPRQPTTARGLPANARRRRGFTLDEEDKYRDSSTPIKPQRLMRELTRCFPPNTRYLADAGNSLAWAIHYLHPFDRRSAGWRDVNAGLFRGCLEFACMGWAIGASVGTALGCPGKPVVCITGDGSLLMSGQELTVAIQHELPVIFVVLNDSALGMVRHGQRLAGAEPIGFELPDVDYCAYARALGAQGHVIRSPRDLRDLDRAALCERKGPTLLDVHIDRDEVPPIGARLEVLGRRR
jgi:acetolactate synthase-1/2/3 large subunit